MSNHDRCELAILEELSVAELDRTLEEAVLEHERSEKLICYALLEMDRKQGYKKFGFISIYDYASQRFDFSDRKTRYLLELARKLTKYPMIEKALAEGKVGWSKAYRMVKLAAAEDEVLSLESAMSLSVRELDRRLRKKMDGVVTKVHLWMTEDQHSVFEYALEVCRRVSGANLSMEQCLEYLAGEFLATWAYEAQAVTEACETESPEPAEPNGQRDDEPVDEETLLAQTRTICPETGDLPPPSMVPRDKISMAVMERDGWTCQYPGCSARAKLHAHHLELRSHFGPKRMEERESLANQTTACVFHHRQVHAGIIGVKGRAPFRLEWRKPKMMEAAELRLERRRKMAERRETKARKAELEAQLSSIEESGALWQTFAKSEGPSDGNESWQTFAKPLEEQTDESQGNYGTFSNARADGKPPRECGGSNEAAL